MTKISFVYFDVGGVAIKDFSDTDKWEIMLSNIGIPIDMRSSADEFLSSHGRQICTGKMDIDNLLPKLRDLYGATIKDDFSLLEYIVKNFERNEGIWDVVKSLQKRYLKLGLLTDQYPKMLDLIIQYQLLPPIKWDEVIDSTQVGFQKPMPEIYELAETKAGVPANEILFIDNRQKNLDGATAAGWQTFLYDSSDYDKANTELAEFISHNI